MNRFRGFYKINDDDEVWDADEDGDMDLWSILILTTEYEYVDVFQFLNFVYFGKNIKIIDR